MRARRGTETRTVVTGVIGADCHIVGNRILQMALEEAGFKVVPLGIMVAQEEFVKAAIETDADAVLVSSLYGQGELDCQGLRDKFEEAGLGRIHLVVGGNLVVGKQEWAEVERRFLAMGFDRAYPPGIDLRRVIEDLRRDLGAPARDG
ncbi:MAG: methylaspartate mutase subunit S [Candidatus Rokubacteria bacterium RIFCSPHIGHO2_02_FULL_69_13]|nr:MAG: methylaspartate mutase S subunit, methylaspartate mutase [Candidatus Rokubacteria bacterium CSP1-6]OGL11855.1 MAG: methylaspartate mutase subunit S [Candidatus Rokubacteria bacterium RIFCSPHIGHO2_02_FULL_69_13]